MCCAEKQHEFAWPSGGWTASSSCLGAAWTEVPPTERAHDQLTSLTEFRSILGKAKKVDQTKNQFPPNAPPILYCWCSSLQPFLKHFLGHRTLRAPNKTPKRTRQTVSPGWLPFGNHLHRPWLHNPLEDRHDGPGDDSHRPPERR